MPQTIAYAAYYVVGNWVGAYIIAYAIVIAAAYSYSQSQARKARRKSRDAYNSSLTDRLVPARATDARRSRVYGRVRNVDAIVFEQTHGTNSEFYTMVITVAGHEVDAIEEVYFDDKLVTLDGSGYVQTAPWLVQRSITAQQDMTVTSGSGSITLANTPIAGTVVASIDVGTGEAVSSYTHTPGGSGTSVTLTGAPVDGTWKISYQYVGNFPKARVRKYLGGPNQDMSADLIATVGGSLITSADRFAGDAALLVTFEYDQDVFPTGMPYVNAVVRGAKCTDPRTGSVAWTENPAVIAYDWATYTYGGGCATSEVVTAAFQAAANACDVGTTFTTTSGIEQRPLYQCGIVCPLDASPDDTMDEIVEAMAGQWGWSGGKLTLRAGVYRAPVAAIDATWLSDVEAIEIAPQTQTADLVNVMRPSIADAAQAYVGAPAAEVRYTAAIAADGRELPREMDLNGVTRAVHAQHICGVYMREGREGLTVKLPCKLHALPLELYDVVTVTLPLFGWSAKLFEVVGWTFSAEAGVILTLRETAAAIYNPDTSFNVLNLAPNTLLPAFTTVPKITGVSVASGTTALLDRSVVVRTRVSWTASTSQAVRQSGRIEVQWTQAGQALPANEWETMEVEGTATSADVIGLRGNVAYIFRVRARTTLGVRGDWSDMVLHVVDGAPLAQGALSSVYGGSAAGPFTATTAGGATQDQIISDFTPDNDGELLVWLDCTASKALAGKSTVSIYCLQNGSPVSGTGNGVAVSTTLAPASASSKFTLSAGLTTKVGINLFATGVGNSISAEDVSAVAQLRKS